MNLPRKEHSDNEPNFRRSKWISERSGRGFVAVAFALVVIYLSYGIFFPENFNHPIQQFCFSILVALFLSLLFHAVSPDSVKLGKIPGLDISMEAVGIAAVFMATAPLLWYLYPRAVNGYFFPFHDRKQPIVLQLQTARLLSDDGNCRYQFARSPKEEHVLSGLYVEFTGKSDQCQITIGNDEVAYSAVFKSSSESSIQKANP